MAKKKRNPNRGKNRVQPKKSFDEMVSDATVNKLSGLVQALVQDYGRKLAQQTVDTFEMVYVRLGAIESILQEKLEVSEDEFANRVAEIEDEAAGMVLAEDEIKAEDRVRFEIETRPKDEENFNPPSRHALTYVGRNTFDSTIEAAMIGKKAGDVFSVTLGEDEAAVEVRVTINRVSRSEGAQDEG